MLCDTASNSVPHLLSGDVETHLANCFPLFKRLADFVLHLGRLVRNFVQQLASLYTAKGPEYTATFKKVSRLG